MPAQYVNRKGHCYTLYEGQTRAGKPKYFCSRKPTSSGVALDAMPHGFEWRENPADGVVSVRKVRPTRITDEERDAVAEGIRRLARVSAFIIDRDGDHLVVWTPEQASEQAANDLGESTGLKGFFYARIREAINQNRILTPMMRFTLCDDGRRLFKLERWCFRGFIDGWIRLNDPAPLDKLISRHVKHLGREGFFELI